LHRPSAPITSQHWLPPILLTTSLRAVSTNNKSEKRWTAERSKIDEHGSARARCLGERLLGAGLLVSGPCCCWERKALEALLPCSRTENEGRERTRTYTARPGTARRRDARRWCGQGTRPKASARRKVCARPPPYASGTARTEEHAEKKGVHKI
jgi:hypothetical protein